MSISFPRETTGFGYLCGFAGGCEPILFRGYHSAIIGYDWLDMGLSGFFFVPQKVVPKKHVHLGFFGGQKKIGTRPNSIVVGNKNPTKHSDDLPIVSPSISPRMSPSIFTICAMANSWIQFLHLVKLGMLISQCSKGFIFIHIHIHIHIQQHIYADTYIYIYTLFTDTYIHIHVHIGSSWLLELRQQLRTRGVGWGGVGC